MTESADKVYIVEDDQSVREALAALVESEGFEAQVFNSAEQLLAGIDRPSEGGSACMLLDVRLPGVDGLTLMKRLSHDYPSLPVILISAHTDVPLAVRAMKQGVVDVIEKPFNGDEVLGRIRDALALHRVRYRQQQRNESLQDRYASLSQREKQVMALVVRGQLNKQIAIELTLSTKTVECHRARVMEKMQAESLADLVRMAVTLEGMGVIERYNPASPLSAN